MEIRSILLVEVGDRLGVAVYARIASAYIAAGIDLFSNPHAGIEQDIGLTKDQLEFASEHGDIHTAVKWYLKWLPHKSLPKDQEECFNPLCFRKMHCDLTCRVKPNQQTGNSEPVDVLGDPDATDSTQQTGNPEPDDVVGDPDATD